MERTLSFETVDDFVAGIEVMTEFKEVSHFYFAICHYLRGYIKWPKIKVMFEDMKLFIGQESMTTKIPTWADLARARRESEDGSKEQALVYELLAMLKERQNVNSLKEEGYYSRHLWRRLYRIPAVSPQVIEDLYYDVRQPVRLPCPIRVLHPTIKSMAKVIRKEDKLSELPYLADACEEYGNRMEEFADHFHSSCKHAYGCAYLRAILGE